MAIRHIVLFELRADLGASKIDAFIDALHALGDDIDFVTNAAAGRDVSGRSTFDLAFTCDLPDVDHISLYGEHPAHVSTVDDWVRPLCESWTVVDQEILSTK